MPATTALVRLAPPSFLAGYTFYFKQKQRLDEAALKAQLTLAGYTPRQPGRLAGRVRGARRADRPVPDGLARCPTGSTCSATRSIRSAPSTPTPSAASTRCPKCACCPAASSRWTRPRAPRSARAGASGSKATRPRRGSTRTSAPASPPPASSTTCRCSSTQTATIFDYLRRDGDAGPARRGRRGAAALLDRHPRAPSLPAARPRAADAAAGGAVPQARGLLRAAATRMRSWRCAAARGADDWARPLPDLSVDRGAPEPLRRLQDHVAAHAAPRADRRRERRPAREPARAAARQPHRAAERSPRSPRSKPATSASRSPSAPLAEGFVWHEPRGRRAIAVRHRDRAVRHLAGTRGAAAQAGAGQRRQCADQGPRRSSRSATRSCTSTTASAATSG